MISKKSLFFIMFAAALVVFSDAYAFAEEAMTIPGERVDYGTGVGKKLGRGLSNAAFGWMDVLKGIEDVGDNQNFIAGITWGPIYGAGRAIQRTAAGVVEVATFPIPAPNNNFEPLVKPEFVMQDDES